ncbi:MAG: biotin synthase [Comamonadaceae bacterium]|nr:MAG: biotin synthase [Comamonadaceae bacterium]
MLPEPSQRPPTIDPIASARWVKLPNPGPSPWLHEEIGRRMEERLQWIKAAPRSWLDWSPLRGGLETHRRVARRYADAAAYVHEPDPALLAATREAFASPWWSARRWSGPRERFGPPPADGVGMLWANMSLHMASDPQALIAQWRDLVATDGFLMFSCFGPDTLRELRALYRRLGWPPSGHEFTDMHDWGDMLVAAGFAEPVMDMERVVLTYASPEAALAELRGLGRNLHPGRFGGLRGRAWRRSLVQALREAAPQAEADARIGFTFEIVYGHAFRPVPRVKLSDQSAVSLRDMRAMLQSGRGPA